MMIRIISLLPFILSVTLYIGLTSCNSISARTTQTTPSSPLTSDARDGYLFGLRLGNIALPTSVKDLVFKDNTGQLFVIEKALRPPEIDLVAVLTTPRKSKINEIHGIIYSQLNDYNIVSTFRALRDALMKKYTSPQNGKPCETVGIASDGHLDVFCPVNIAATNIHRPGYIISAKIEYDGQLVFNLRKRFSRDFNRLIHVSLYSNWIPQQEIENEEEEKEKSEEERKRREKARSEEEQRIINEKIQNMHLNPVDF